MSKKILIMAGGTGGHIFPALAIANELKNQSANIEWLGSSKGMESSLIPQHGFHLHTVSVVGLRGKNILQLLKALFLLPFALFQTLKIFIKIKPNRVIGMGGFSSGIGGVVAWMLRIPLVIHEQNAIPGATNLLLSKLANQTFQAFENTFNLRTHAITSGNPILFSPQNKTSVNTPLNLLVLGGSLGAKSINKVIPKLSSKVNIWHQTGKQHLELTKALYKKNTAIHSTQLNLKVVDFINDMASAYAWADVVICRSGAMTISELIATQSVAILIPFPFATGNHQLANAKILSDKGAAILLQQNELNAEKLDSILSNIDFKKITHAISQFELRKSEKIISNYLLMPNLSNSA